MNVIEAHRAALIAKKLQYALDDQKRALVALKRSLEAYQDWLDKQINPTQFPDEETLRIADRWLIEGEFDD